MMTRFRFFTALALTSVLTACTAPTRTVDAPSSKQAAQATAGQLPLPFSSSQAQGLPSGWTPLIINRTKTPTRYQLVSERGRTVLHAQAKAAASGLMHEVSLDPARRPWLSWQWKVARLIDGADNFERYAEDSPVRIVLAFDGDKDALPFADQLMFETGKLVTGRELPYATLMYIWENKAPVGTVIANTRTGRVKMMVAASGANGVGTWRQFSRNIVEDFKNAFGEPPGRLIGIGVMTDSDNTGQSAEAWYGDIQLQPERGLALN